MKKILIDVSALKSDNQNAMLGIKYFISKNKEDELTVIGDSNDTVTIHQNKRIIIAQLDTDEVIIEPEYKDIKEKNIRMLLSLIKREHFDSFVTFSSLDELKPYIEKYFTKIKSPIMVTSFANIKTHKCTLFGDLGYNLESNKKDMESYLEQLKEYASGFMKFKTTKFKILSNDNALINSFKNDEDFEGKLNPIDLYNANTDIILTDANTSSITINAINGAISTYDAFIKEEVRKNVGLRYFVFPMFKSVITSFHMNIDQKLTSGGMTLLGFNKKIVFVDKNTIAMGVKAAIDTCAKF